MVELNSKSVLILSSNNDESALIKHHIESSFTSKFIIVNSNSSRDALKKFKFQKFDLIITEQEADGFNPLKFSNSLEETAYNKNTPMIHIRNASTAETSVKIKNFVETSRPVNFAKLTDLIAKQLGLTNDEAYKVSTIYSKLVDSAQSFLSAVAGDTSQILSPKSKAKDEELLGDIYIDFSFMINNSIERKFVMSFAKANIIELFNKTNQTSRQSMDEAIINAALTVIIKSLRKIFKYGDIDLIEKNILRADSNPKQTKQLKKSSGIFTPIKTKKGVVRVYAF